MNGCKRHLLVDTTELLQVHRHPADMEARDCAGRFLALLDTLFFWLAVLWADAGYQGTCARWITATFGWAVEIVRKPRRRVRIHDDQGPLPMSAGFHVLPRRWVVEHTLAWLGRYRHQSKGYEKLPATEEVEIPLAMFCLIVA